MPYREDRCNCGAAGVAMYCTCPRAQVYSDISEVVGATKRDKLKNDRERRLMKRGNLDGPLLPAEDDEGEGSQ